MPTHALNDVLEEQLKDLLNAEEQLVKALPKLARAANNAELREALDAHLRSTLGHVERLAQVFAIVGTPEQSKSCKGMEGLVAEGEEIINRKAERTAAACDAAIVAAAQRAEHYEISAYGSARAFAESMGHPDAATILQQTLDEEIEADKTLTRVAATINREAAQGS